MDTQINEEKTKIYQEMNDLVYAGIHDIKSPLANLKLINRLLRTLKNLNEVKEYANMTATALAQVEVSIDGLAAVLNLQSHHNPTVETVNFSQVLSKLKDKFKNLELQENFTDAPEIRFDPFYITLLLENIASNSARHHREDGKVKLELVTQREGECLVLKARDNGRGIDLTRYGSKIFMPFTKIQSDGAGVGLYLIKTIAEKNGGKVEIESNVGTGTVLEIHLKEYKSD